MIYFFVFIGLFVIEVAYFRLADYCNIIDKPNGRSLHTQVTIRGGGIIFPIAAFIYLFYSGIQYPYFFVGLFFISFISFLDDIYTIPNWHRIVIQFLSVFLLIYQLDINSQLSFWVILLVIVLVGIINAYNFMDGINGITGGYSLANLVSLLFVNNYLIKFIENEFIIFVSIGLLIFNFYNFRKHAKCFAGDIGSISIAFINVFLLIKLITLTNQWVYILFLSLYGVDTIFTLLRRIWQKENIFEAHNKHLFQLLVQKRGFLHLQVSTLYVVLQLIINSLIIFVIKSNVNVLSFSVVMLIIISCGYIYCKRQIMKTRITIK